MEPRVPWCYVPSTGVFCLGIDPPPVLAYNPVQLLDLGYAASMLSKKRLKMPRSCTKTHGPDQPNFCQPPSADAESPIVYAQANLTVLSSFQPDAPQRPRPLWPLPRLRTQRYGECAFRALRPPTDLPKPELQFPWFKHLASRSDISVYEPLSYSVRGYVPDRAAPT